MKEQVLAAARKLKPPNILFLQDFSQQNLEQRRGQNPQFLTACGQGKIDYFIGDKLKVKEKPPEVHPPEEHIIQLGYGEARKKLWNDFKEIETRMGFSSFEDGLLRQ